MYDYHNGPVRPGRLQKGTDRCQSNGTVYSLAPLIVNGHIADPSDPFGRLTTVGTYIYAVDANLGANIAPDGNRAVTNAVKHETLFHNAPVLAAGEIVIRDGVIEDLNDRSGSYQTEGELATNPDFASVLLEAFRGLLSLPLERKLLQLKKASP